MKNFIIIFKTILIFFLLTEISLSNTEDKLLEKIKNTNTLTFDFKQKISDKIQTGNCSIKYPKLLKCDYNDEFHKRLISNGKTLAVIQRRYKKIFYYPLKTTPLFLILDKKYIVNFIKNNHPVESNKEFFKYEILEKKNEKLTIYFEKKTLNFLGWETVDMYQNRVEFLIYNQKINTIIDENFFKIPSEDKL